MTRILLVGEDPLARSGLLALFSEATDLSVVQQAAPDDDLEALVEESQADIVLWDAGLDLRPDIATIADLNDVPVLLLIGSTAFAGEAIATGARGVMRRGLDTSRLSAALRAVSHGLMVLDPAFVQDLVRPPAGEVEPLQDTLTAREQQVLNLMAQGLANKAIARRLGISEHTAKFHVNSILAKLGVQSRTEAVVRALRLGLVAL